MNLLMLSALKYLNMGYVIIPLKPNGKEPLIKWQEYQKRKSIEEEIKKWWVKWPNANVGIVTGQVSQLAVVDLDGMEGIKEGLRLGITSTLSSITGNGKQLWYRHPGGIIQNSVRSYPGVDIRADGGYVVAPPSIHPNGKRYRFSTFVQPAETLPLFPMALFVSAVPENADVKNEPGWIAKALEEMKDGNIDDTLFKICSRLRNDGYTEKDTIALIGPHAERAGAIPGHLEDKIRNVWGRYEPKNQRSIIGTLMGSLILHSPTNPDSLNEYRNRLQMASNTQMSTGYSKFDTLTKGLKKGEVLTVAARTGVGKTNWIITPIREFCQMGKKVLLFSTEMSFDQIWQRYKSTLSRPEVFQMHSFFICDEFTPNIERIEEAIKNVQPDLFVFDHISHIGTDYHIISKFMSEIKRLSRLYNIPAIVTAQLNRHADYVEQGQRIEPRLSMIQGSDQIGQMSAQVLLLNEKRVNGDMTEIEGIIVKNRHGDKGLIQFALVKDPYRMIEL